MTDAITRLANGCTMGGFLPGGGPGELTDSAPLNADHLDESA